ncbi:MAG: rhombosortase [Magnetospiraceae bacterium]
MTTAPLFWKGDAGGPKPLAVALFLAAGLFGIFALTGPVPPGLVGDRQAILEGEIWRLFTSHLVHTDFRHLTLNALAVLIIAPFVGTPRDLGLAILAGMLAVGLGVLLLQPHIAAYCGFSGVLNTLVVVALMREWRRAPHWLLAVFLAGVPAKILYELLAHPLLTEPSWPALPGAHGFGFVAGVLLALWSGQRIHT